jgi:peptidylprolyl isomerase
MEQQVEKKEEKHHEHHVEHAEHGKKAMKMKPAYILAAIVVVAVALAIAYFTIGSSAQVVAIGDNVSVYYTGTLTNGTVFDTNVGQSPLSFTVGSSQIISGFSQGVIGMKLNSNRTLTLPPNEAYGPINQSLFITVPTSALGNESVAIGMHVTAPNGNQGVITAVTANNVTADFNPPLAGKTLIFQIQVVGIKAK